ncbi:MAG: glycosyltransferase family 2 protein [Halioglobus sp.]|nr:glycosyltransferase family 2 protein [Halioglobus sp.]
MAFASRLLPLRRPPEVSVLIPAYMAEAFIDRTLHFARGQTFPRIKILVSVDAGEDQTAEIVRRHEDQDKRIVLHSQPKRLGWAGNVNYLLERVDTPYFFIYFHDDILLPQYTEKLLAVLTQNASAAGVYCDLCQFGATQRVSTGPAYTGSLMQRLLTLMLSLERGSPLRALLRSAHASHLRLPDRPGAGFWANEPFLMDMVAAGPLEQVPEVLYMRWNNRPGGLTDGWKKLPLAEATKGWHANIEARLELIARMVDDEHERRALRFALFLHAFPAMQTLLQASDGETLKSPADVHPLFASPDTPEAVAGYGNPIAAFARERYTFCMSQGLYE